ncbi:transforming growth factor beta receptor type 3-like, partial [Diretmus argenteus]
PLHSLPFGPRALLRWALKQHGSLSSLTHTTHGNRIYIRLGEDPTLSDVCHLQSLFLSHNYMTSDLQPQEVQGCTHAVADGNNPEVHVIRLHSAGSGLCGSLQVEVMVSLVPPVANSGTHQVVLILSSSVPVNWAVTTDGLRGHISVHSSNSVSSPSPPEPHLTLSSMVHSDLSTMPDLLVWANENGFPKVTSYTEAGLANRFLIQLAGGGTEVIPTVDPVVVWPPWAEEHSLRQWLTGGGRAGGGREAFTVQCEDGRLNVTLDRHILQILSLRVAAVTLRDPQCKAQSNGTHFLLVFPVISCGTEGLLLGRPRGVQYKNMFSCLAAVPTPPSPLDGAPTPQSGLDSWEPQDPGPDPVLGSLPRPRPGPLLILKLFVTEGYERRPSGPCVIAADHRVYVEVSTTDPIRGAVEVSSCVVSPVSDPRKSRFWTVIRDGCSVDPSLTLSYMKEDGEEEEDDEVDGAPEKEREEKEGTEEGRDIEEDHKDTATGVSFRRRTPSWRQNSEDTMGELIRDRGKQERGSSMGTQEEVQLLRFSFILRPVYIEPMQFLHCSLRLCVSDSSGDGSMKETTDCGQGGQHIPPLVSTASGQQCEMRNLSRPMVVTQPIGSLAAKPPPGQRTRELSVSQPEKPIPTQSRPVMGIVLVAFIMGLSLMGALWCICNHTGTRPPSVRRESLMADGEQNNGSHSSWDPPALLHQSTSSV